MMIAERWFERRTYTDDVTLLWEPAVHPLLRCNIWFVRGRDRDLLIDTGLGIGSLAKEIADLVDKPLLALATHIHYDHVGSLHEFKARAMHRLEAPRMTDYQEFSSLLSRDFPPGFLGDYADAPEFDRYLIRARPHAAFQVSEYRVRSTPITQLLDDGDVIDLGDRHFSVMHLPGHSPGSIGLYEAASATLFSGDVIYDGVLLDQLPDSNIADYLTSLQRLRKLPVRVVHGGHEASFDGGRLRELVDAYVAARTGSSSTKI